MESSITLTYVVWVPKSLIDVIIATQETLEHLSLEPANDTPPKNIFPKVLIFEKT